LSSRGGGRVSRAKKVTLVIIVYLAFVFLWYGLEGKNPTLGVVSILLIATVFVLLGAWPYKRSGR